jgi:hypothetical protein
MISLHFEYIKSDIEAARSYWSPLRVGIFLSRCQRSCASVEEFCVYFSIIVACKSTESSKGKKKQKSKPATEVYLETFWSERPNYCSLHVFTNASLKARMSRIDHSRIRQYHDDLSVEVD